MADALDDWVDGVAERFEGLAREPAGAGFVPGEAAAVEQQNALARACEVVCRGASGGACAGDQDVVVEGHRYSL